MADKKKETPYEERIRKEKEKIKQHKPKLNKNRGGGGRIPKGQRFR